MSNKNDRIMIVFTITMNLHSFSSLGLLKAICILAWLYSLAKLLLCIRAGKYCSKSNLTSHI